MVTQAPAGQQPVSQPQKVTDWREAPAPPSAPPNTIHPQEMEPSSVPATSVTQLPQPKASLPPSQEVSVPLQSQVPAVEALQLPGAHSPQPEVTLEENEPQPEPVNLSVTASPCSRLLDFQIRAEEALTQTGQLKTRDIDDILKEVIEEETEKAERARNLASVKTADQCEAALGVILIAYSLFKQILVTGIGMVRF